MKLLSWQALANNRLIHSLKTALAVLIGYAITKSVHFPVDQWLIITILVVMCAQMNVGSMIQKSYMRFLGTLLGSLVAIFTLTFFGTKPIVIAIVLFLAAMLFSYIATSQKSYSDSGTLGAVTISVILVGQHPTVITAAGRFLEISIGILIAALVSQFILPIHARRNLRNIQAHTLRQLRDYYQATLINEHIDYPLKNLTTLDETIAKSLIEQRKLSMEAMREPFKKVYNLKRFTQLLWGEKEILRCIGFMYHAYHASPRVYTLFSTMRVLHQFHTSACDTLDKIANFFEKNDHKKEIALPSVAELKTAIFSGIKILTQEEAVYASGFLCAAEILVARMQEVILQI